MEGDEEDFSADCVADQLYIISLRLHDIPSGQYFLSKLGLQEGLSFTTTDIHPFSSAKALKKLIFS